MSARETPTSGPTGLPLHTRSLGVEAFAEPPGRVRFAGAIVDQRKVGFVPTGGDLQTAGTIHHMQLELELDLATREILRLDASQPTVAYEPSPATRGESCRDPVPRLQALVGQPIDRAFPKRLATVFGGPLGCSHLLTLAQLMGASAHRVLTDDPLRDRARGERIAKRALFLDGFERAEGALDVVIQLSEFRLCPDVRAESPLDRLASQHEVQVFATLEPSLSALARLDARERERSPDALDADWIPRSAEVAPLEGAPALGGLAPRVLRLFGERDEDAPLRDALLNLAPGIIQCLAAFSQRLLTAFRRDRNPRPIPRELSVGGFPDSCYVWRAGGPMTLARAAVAPDDSPDG